MAQLTIIGIRDPKGFFNMFCDNRLCWEFDMPRKVRYSAGTK
jgi:hypothetical protein